MDIDSKDAKRSDSRRGSQQTKTPKLRGSCDACSQSKVKCDKEQPTCNRCVNLGISCNYSPSRRMGKPPSSSTAANHDRQHKKRSSAPIAAMVIDSGQDSGYQSAASSFSNESFANWLNNSNFVGLSMPGLDSVDPMSWPESTVLNSGDNQFMQDFNWDEIKPYPSDLPPTSAASVPPLFDSSFSLPNQPPVHQRYHTAPTICHYSEKMDESDDDMGSPFGFSSLDSKQPTPAAWASQPSSSSMSSQSCPSSQNCTELAFSTLQSLTFPGNPGSSSAVMGRPPVDKILKSNKSAIDNLITLLTCACSLDPQFALLVALIAFKILGWYQAVAGIDSSSPSNTLDSTLSPTENIKRMPIMVGGYTLDGDDKDRMEVQLVLSELRKVAQLVDKFTKRFCEGNDGAVGKDGGICRSLESFLRMRLKGTVNALREKLKGQDKHLPDIIH